MVFNGVVPPKNSIIGESGVKFNFKSIVQSAAISEKSSEEESIKFKNFFGLFGSKSTHSEIKRKLKGNQELSINEANSIYKS